MARRPQNYDRVRDLREVIEERRAARLLAEAQARAALVHQARSVAQSMISSGEYFVAELRSVRPNTREFIIPMRIPLEDIVRNGLAPTMRHILLEFPVLSLLDPATASGLRLANIAWDVDDQPMLLVCEFENI